MTAMRVVVGGIDCTLLVDPSTLQVQTPVSRKGATAQFTLRDIFDITSSLSIPPLTSVTIYDVDGVTAIFDGLITKPTAIPIYANENDWQCQCQDDIYTLDAVLVNKEYVNQTDKEIIADLFATYLPTVDASSLVQQNTVVPHIIFGYNTMTQALQRLQALAQTQEPILWWITPARQLFWAGISQLPAAPFILSDVATGANVAHYQRGSTAFQLILDGTQVINAVTVHGGAAVSNPTTDNWLGDGVSSSFLFTFPPSQQAGAGLPTVTVNGVAQTVAIDDGKPPTTQWIVSYPLAGGSASLRTGTASVPASGVPIVATYSYDVPVLVKSQNPSSIAEYAPGSITGGVYAKLVEDTSIQTFQAAQSKAQSYLASHAFAIPTVQCTLLEDFTGVGLQVGQQIPITCSQLGLESEPYVITQITWRGTAMGKRQMDIVAEAVSA